MAKRWSATAQHDLKASSVVRRGTCNNLIEAAQLDPQQEAKLELELSRQYHILTRDDRLETVAQDIVRHFLWRGFLGKAMVVSIDKATALKMHDKCGSIGRRSASGWSVRLRR